MSSFKTSAFSVGDLQAGALPQPSQRRRTVRLASFVQRRRVWPGSTSQRKREFDSENSREKTLAGAAELSSGILAKSTWHPNSPQKPSQPKATAKPPSLRSWQLRTCPL